MATNVTIGYEAFSDRRIPYLGELAGYSHMEALGRLATLWSRCTELQTDQPGVIELRACLGPRGEAHLVEAGLGEVMEDGQVRVRGCHGRIEWFEEVKSKAVIAGRSRAATAPRDARGRMMRSSGGPADRRDLSSGSPASAGEIGPKHQRPPASESESESDPNTDPEREDQNEDLPLPEPQIPLPGGSRSPDQDLEVELRRTDAHVAAVGAARKQSWGRLNDLRKRIAAELGIEARPLPLHDAGERALGCRLREAESVESGLADVEHVLAIAGAEARATKSVQWLIGSMFEERSWRRALGMTLADVAARPRDRNMPMPVIRMRRASDDDMPPLPPEAKG